MDEKELQALYNAVSAKFDIGDFSSFKSKMSTSGQRESFFNVVKSHGFDLGDYNAYETRLAGKKKEEAVSSSPVSSPPLLQSAGDFLSLRNAPESQSSPSGQQATTEQQPETLQLDFSQPDPVGQAIFPLDLQKKQLIQRNASADATGTKPILIDQFTRDGKMIHPRETEIAQLSDKMNAISANAFENTDAARDYVASKLAGKNISVRPENVSLNSPNKIPLDRNNIEDLSLDDIKANLTPGNVTERVAFDKYQRSRNIRDAIDTSGDLEEAALKYTAAQNPRIKAQIDALGGVTDNLPNAFAGAKVREFLYSPEVIEHIKDDPKLVQQWKEAEFNWYNHYPDAAKQYVSQLISQERENRGMNNAIVNIPTQGSTDDLVDQLVTEGKMNPQDVALYKSQIRPMIGVTNSIGRGIGRLVAPAVVNESPIATPGFLENTEDSYVNTLRGAASSIEDVAQGINGAPLFDKQKRLNDLLQHDYSAVQVDPKNFWNGLGQTTGHITGFLAPMILGGEIAKAAGAPGEVGNMITNAMLFEGPNRDEAIKMFPDNPDKQYAYTAIATAGDVAMGKLFPTKETADAARKLMRSDIENAVSKFTDGAIDASQARSQVLDGLKRLITEKAPSLLEKNAEMGGVMSAFNIFHNGLDAAFGGRDVTAGQAAVDAINTFKSGFLGGAALNLLRVATEGDRVKVRSIMEMANNPDYFRKVIEDGASVDPQLEGTKNERLANLNAAAKINEDLKQTDLNERQKEEYLIAGLKQNLWQRRAEGTNDDVLKAQYEKKANEFATQKADILNLQATGAEAPAEQPLTDEQKFAPKIVEQQPAPTTTPAAEQTPETSLTALAKTNAKELGVYGELLNDGSFTPEQVLLDLAKQKYGLNDDGSDAIGGGREIKTLFKDQGESVDNLVTQKYPDKQTVLSEIKPEATQQSPQNIPQETAQNIPEIKTEENVIPQETKTPAQTETVQTPAPVAPEVVKASPTQGIISDFKEGDVVTGESGAKLKVISKAGDTVTAQITETSDGKPVTNGKPFTMKVDPRQQYSLVEAPKEKPVETTATEKAAPPKAKIFERPEMEHPIYEVAIGDKKFYIQRSEGMNPGDTAWYEVVKDKNGRGWKAASGVEGVMDFGIGYTKKEAIDHLANRGATVEETKPVDEPLVQEIKTEAAKPETQTEVLPADQPGSTVPKVEEKVDEVKLPTETATPQFSRNGRAPRAYDKGDIVTDAAGKDYEVIEPGDSETPAKLRNLENGQTEEHSNDNFDYTLKEDRQPDVYTEEDVTDIVTKIKNGEQLSPEEQRIRDEIPEEISKRLKKETRNAKNQKFDKKVDDVADALKKALGAKLPEGTQKQGVGINDVIDAAANIVKKAHKLGGDVAAAIDEAIVYMKDEWTKNNWDKKFGPMPEQNLRFQLNSLTQVPTVNKAAADKFSTISGDDAERLVNEQSDKLQQALDEKRKRTFGKFYKSFVKHVEDVSGNVKEALRNAGGEEAVMNKDIANKSGGMAGQKIKENDKVIFDGLTDNEQKSLGQIINARRTIFLDRQKDIAGEERVKHSSGYTSELYDKYLQNLEAKDPARYQMLNARADEYFKAQKELLDMMKGNGLLSDDLYQALSENLYSPRIFIDKLEEFDNGFNGGSKVSVGDAGIKQLKEGSEGLMVEDPRLLLSYATSKAFKLMTKNDAAVSLYNFAKSTPGNGIARVRKVTGVTKDGNIKYEDIPFGEEAVHAMINGRVRDVIMPKEYAKEWVSNDPAISSGLGEALQWLTGVAPLRLAATGFNPIFALANMPRDMAYITLTTNAYSKFLPKAVAQLGHDMATVAPDVLSRSGRYRDFIKEGGSIELLTHQGRLLGTKAENEGINKITHALGWLGETSELMTRIAMRERGIKNGTKEFVDKNGRQPNNEELKKIQKKATYDAINQLDFSQGGDYAKAINKMIPYFNASIQATRALARAARTNPKEFWIKAGQFAALAGGLTAYNAMQPGYKDVSDDDKASNFIFMLPTYRVDENGQKRYQYIKIPKTQEVQGLSAIMDQIVNYAQTGERPGAQEIKKALGNQLPDVPFVTQGIPMREAIRNYVDNYDAYFDQKLWKGRQDVPNKFQFTRKTPEAYRIVGKYTGLSPDRLRGATRAVLPGIEKNPFFTIPSKLFNVGMEASGAVKGTELRKTFMQHFKDITGGFSGKYVGETYPQRPKKGGASGGFSVGN